MIGEEEPPVEASALVWSATSIAPTARPGGKGKGLSPYSDAHGIYQQGKGYADGGNVHGAGSAAGRMARKPSQKAVSIARTALIWNSRQILERQLLMLLRGDDGQGGLYRGLLSCEDWTTSHRTKGYDHCLRERA